MNRFAKILSDDARFKKMLSLELSSIGIEVCDMPEKKDSTDQYYTVVDLDNAGELEKGMFIDGSIAIGFTKSASMLDSNLAKECSYVFKRPFLMSNFIALFGATDIIRAPHKRAINKETHKKPQFLTVSPDSCEAIWGEIRIPLSETEYRVLALLCEHRGETVERKKLYSLLGAEDGNMGDVYICHLRRKIDNKLGLKLIYTVRGKGYMLKN